MDEMISYIKGPLDKFMSLMDKVSEDIKKIGGWGYVHGCIVDIDYYNHIYVNPNDLTLTGYWAYDMVEKFVYPNIPSLLKAECPEVYGNYIKYIGESKNALIIGDLRDGKMKNIRPKEYLSTDIYKTSREIKRMQKLRSNILSSWYEDSNKKSKSNLNDKKLNSSVYDKGIIKKKTVVLQGDTVDSQNENERLKHICGLKGNLSVSDNNEIRFRQWLTDDRFIDKVIEEYVADVKATVNDHGKTLFEMKSYDEIEEYIKQNEGKCTPKGRAAFKYYKRCMKEEML